MASGISPMRFKIPVAVFSLNESIGIISGKQLVSKRNGILFNGQRYKKRQYAMAKSSFHSCGNAFLSDWIYFLNPSATRKDTPYSLHLILSILSSSGRI